MRSEDRLIAGTLGEAGLMMWTGSRRLADRTLVLAAVPAADSVVGRLPRIRGGYPWPVRPAGAVPFPNATLSHTLPGRLQLPLVESVDPYLARA